MKSRGRIRRWCSWAGLFLALTASSFGQNRRDQQRNVPRPNAPERHESRPNVNREPARREPQFQSAPQPPRHSYPDFQPPAQGHHSGQWLNQQRQQSAEQQRRALENDPAFRRLPQTTQRQYEQRLQHFNSLPPDRQHQVLRRMETWEHLTPQQKQQFLGMRDQFNSLSPDRRRAVHNAIDSLRAMPPEARQRELESGRFSQFSPQERQILNDATRLPLATAPQESSGPAPDQQNDQPNTGRERYVPRPPR